MLRSYHGALCALAALPAVVFAQATIQGEEVVVTSSRIEQRLRDAIPHTTVITRKEIQDSQAFDLPSILQREAGFEFTQNGGVGALSGTFMRGGRSAQALILVDGVRIEDAGAGATALQHIMADEIERVEIVRGNVSSLYGSGAIGGVIQVFTRRGTGAPAGNAHVTLGSRGTSKLSGGFGGQAGDTRFNISASRLETNGFSAIDPRLAPAANPDNDGYRNESISASVSHRLSQRHELGASLYSTRGRVEYDSAFNTATSRHDSAQDLGMMQAYWQAQFVDAWKSRLSVSEGKDYRRDTLNGNFANSSNTRNRGFAWDNQFRIARGHELTGAIERMDQSISNSGLAVPQRKRDVNIARIGYLGNIGRHTLQANVRTEDYSDFGRADTYFFGYGLDLTERWRLTASTSTAFRAPTFLDLYGFGGNAALRPEKARTHEAGIQWAAGTHRVRMVLFNTDYQDAITFDNFTFTVRNVRKAHVTGIETSYTGQVAGFDLRASFTVQDPVEQEPGGLELQAVRRAKAFGAFSAYRSWGAWRLGGDLRISEDRRDTNIVSGASLREGGYTVANLTARYQFDKQFYAAAKLENAFDEKYRLVHGYNTPRRGLFVTVGWQQ